jgi:hypothetical protein
MYSEDRGVDGNMGYEWIVGSLLVGSWVVDSVGSG